jgi:hypothetical protein
LPGLAASTDIPALKELEECFDARASNPENLNSYFTRTKNLQSGG